MIWVAIAAIVTAAAIVVVVTRRNRRETVVPGRHMADARANEAARFRSGHVGPSPMPGGDYDEDAGDYDFTAVTERPLDRALRAVVRAFRAWSPDERAGSRHRLSADEQYTLIHFAKRSSILALQEGSTARCEDGLLALAMLDETQVDRRDGAWAAGLLSHAIHATTTDPDALVSEAAALATPEMAKIVMRAAARSNLSDWGYTEIRTSNGVGLVQSEGARYEPTLDMSGLALRLAANLQRGRYTAEPKLAVEVPPVWFAKAHRDDATRLLQKARAGISVRGRLRRTYTDRPFAQLFVQWVVEMPAAEDANTLVEYAGVNTRLGDRFVTGMASGRLFSLLAAGSSMAGVAPFESPESLASLANETRPLLQDAAR